MRKKITAVASGALLVVALGGLAVCGGTDAAQASAGPAVGEPSLMPASHEGRFYELGADGCYGCHGANETTDHMLAQATPLPADHYVDGDVSTYEVFGARRECLTCHSQG